MSRRNQILFNLNKNLSNHRGLSEEPWVAQCSSGLMYMWYHGKVHLLCSDAASKSPNTSPTLYHTKLTCYCLKKWHFNLTSLEYLKQLGSERYKITYAAAIVPMLCMFVKILIGRVLSWNLVSLSPYTIQLLTWCWRWGSLLSISITVLLLPLFAVWF